MCNLSIVIFLLLVSDIPGRVSCDFEDVEVRRVVDVIVAASGFNVVYGKAVAGRVTVCIQDMEWNEALDIVMKLTGLVYERVGNCLYVDSYDNISEQRTGTPYFQEYKVRDIHISTIAERLRELVSSKGIVFSDERTGKVVVYDYSDVQERVQAFISAMDTPAPQVLIDVRIVEVIRSSSDAVEFHWDLEELLLPLQQIIETGFRISEEEGIAGFLSIDIATITEPSVGVLIQALSEGSKSSTVISGGILAQENFESSLLAGNRFSVPTRDISGNTILQMFSSGFEIAVTPHITSDKHVNLKMKIALSDLDRASALMGRPIVSALETEVMLHLADGETAIIAKHSEDDDGDKKKRLGQPEIPLLEYLIAPWSRSIDVIHQYIIITPYIQRSANGVKSHNTDTRCEGRDAGDQMLDTRY